MELRDIPNQIAALAVLHEPVRRDLYGYVASQPNEVSRDQAARAVGVSRTLAGFHLDRLADEGLLETSFRRLSGKTGPGAGRPSKLYRRSDRQLAVSLPQRSYELAARILAAAVDVGGTRKTQAALTQVARDLGRHIGKDAKARSTTRRGRKNRVAGTVAALAEQGYEPVQVAGEIRLRNCPFHALVADHTQLVCGMNLALVEGVVSALDVPGAQPALDPRPGMCCVVLKLGKG